VALPAWVPEIETKPAPEPLLLVQALVNTRDLDRRTDMLSDGDSARAWLRDAKLLGGRTPLTADDLNLVREVRESVRALLEHNAGGPEPTQAALRPLTDLASSLRPRLTLDKTGQIDVAPEPRGRVADGLLGLLLIIRDAQTDGTWPRLKACGNPGCRWAFFDRSHSRRGAWCDMSSCGNKIKNRNLRARKGAAI
jgi:predicted RNA-binding Zn ribbon-like protein